MTAQGLPSAFWLFNQRTGRPTTLQDGDEMVIASVEGTIKFHRPGARLVFGSRNGDNKMLPLGCFVTAGGAATLAMLLSAATGLRFKFKPERPGQIVYRFLA